MPTPPGPRRARSALLAAAGALALALTAAGPAAAAAPDEGEVTGAFAPDAVAGSYLVSLNPGYGGSTARLAARFGATVRADLTTVDGFTATMDPAAARRLAADPAVAVVEQDRRVKLAATQTGAEWGLDRIDQKNLPLTGAYTYPTSAANVTAYVLDTGVRLTHTEFGGRARSGWDFIDNDPDASDCHGHGTHVAGTVAGKTYGVAKAAKVVSVRVLACDGSGTLSGVLGGIDWVTKNAVKPAVANMSLGGSYSFAINNAVKTAVASGLTFTVSAGNDSIDACQNSPASTESALTVGATDSTDRRADFSNWGKCLDIFAPGVGIKSAYVTGDTATETWKGTSMAAPHVAGAAALYLSLNPTGTPAQVRTALVAGANLYKVTDPMGSTNRLLYIGGITVPPCVVSDGTDRPIADRTTVVIPVKPVGVGCTGNASATSKVEVHVVHPDRGDLRVTLVAPDGTSYKLKIATTGDNVANLDATYTVDLSSEPRTGTWKLNVADLYANSTGTLDSFKITL